MAKITNEVINANLQNLIKSFEEYKTDSKGFVAEMTKRVDSVENAAIENRTRINNFALFQMVLSAVIGAIASYIGINHRV